MTNEATTLTFGRINQHGREALIDWLRERMREPMHAEATADDLIHRLDGSHAEACGLTVELGQFKSASGHPETYSFDGHEYDLVEIDEDGNEIMVG